MAGLFGSITIKGNRLTEFASQTSTVGIPIPFGFGKFPCEGNIIFAPMPPKEHVKKKKQGKGGVKTEEYSYTLSYAIAFCEGPIYGFWTIKRNGKVVWTQDPDASVDDKAYAAKWAQKATFYFGTETQLPDSTIESYKGIGQVSAHRGIAYIVVEDDDVTDNGGAVPTYEAVIIASPPDAYLTSRPYPNDMAVEAVSVESYALRGELKRLLLEEQDSMEVTSEILEGELRDIYNATSTEDYLESSSQVISGELKSTYQQHTALPEALETSSTVQSGTLKIALLSTTMQPEALETSSTVQSGTLGP